MGVCVCLNTESEKSQYYLIKEEPKRFLPAFSIVPNEKKNQRSTSKNSNQNFYEEAGSKNTPATLVFNNEENPFSKNASHFEKEKNQPTFENFNIKKVIGKGSYGKVLLVEKKDSGTFMKKILHMEFLGKYYAMKVIKKEDIEKRNQKTSTKTERNILGKMKSPFVVQLKYAFQNNDKLYMVMEFMRGGMKLKFI